MRSLRDPNPVLAIDGLDPSLRAYPENTSCPRAIVTANDPW